MGSSTTVRPLQDHLHQTTTKTSVHVDIKNTCDQNPSGTGGTYWPTLLLLSNLVSVSGRSSLTGGADSIWTLTDIDIFSTTVMVSMKCIPTECVLNDGVDVIDFFLGLRKEEFDSILSSSSDDTSWLLTFGKRCPVEGQTVVWTFDTRCPVTCPLR